MTSLIVRDMVLLITRAHLALVKRVNGSCIKGAIWQKIQLQNPKSCLDRLDIPYTRRWTRQKHKSELLIQLQKGATDSSLPSHGPLFPTCAMKRNLERDMKKAYIIQQFQQGLSDTGIVQKIRLQDPDSCLDSQDISNLRRNQKWHRPAFHGQILKGATDDDLAEDHKVSKEGIG